MHSQLMNILFVGTRVVLSHMFAVRVFYCALFQVSENCMRNSIFHSWASGPKDVGKENKLCVCVCVRACANRYFVKLSI